MFCRVFETWEADFANPPKSGHFSDPARGVTAPLMYGTDGLQGARVDQRRIDLMMQDGCVGVFYKEPCSDIMGGVLNTGLHAGLTEFVRFSRLQLLSRRQNIQNHNERSITARLADPQLDELRIFGRQHLRDALRASSEAVSAYTERVLEGYQAVHTFLTIGVGVTLLLGYLLIQLPIMHRLDGDVKRSRATLLYIPPAAVEQVPAVRQLLIHAGVLTPTQMKAVLRRGW